MAVEETTECQGCQRLQQELSSTKSMYAVKFQTLKEKIVSTDILIRKYAEKSQEVNKLNQELNEINHKLNETNQVVDHLQSECSKYENYLKDTLSELEPLKKEKVELDKVNKENVLCIQNLTQKLESTQATLKQYEDKRNQNSDQKFEELKKKLTKATKKVEKYSETNDNLNRKVRVQLSQLKRLENKYKNAVNLLMKYADTLKSKGCLPTKDVKELTLFEDVKVDPNVGVMSSDNTDDEISNDNGGTEEVSEARVLEEMLLGSENNNTIQSTEEPNVVNLEESKKTPHVVEKPSDLSEYTLSSSIVDHTKNVQTSFMEKSLLLQQSHNMPNITTKEPNSSTSPAVPSIEVQRIEPSHQSEKSLDLLSQNLNMPCPTSILLSGSRNENHDQSITSLPFNDKSLELTPENINISNVPNELSSPPSLRPCSPPVLEKSQDVSQQNIHLVNPVDNNYENVPSPVKEVLNNAQHIDLTANCDMQRGRFTLDNKISDVVQQNVDIPSLNIEAITFPTNSQAKESEENMDILEAAAAARLDNPSSLAAIVTKTSFISMNGEGSITGEVKTDVTKVDIHLENETTKDGGKNVLSHANHDSDTSLKIDTESSLSPDGDKFTDLLPVKNALMKPQLEPASSVSNSSVQSNTVVTTSLVISDTSHNGKEQRMDLDGCIGATNTDGANKSSNNDLIEVQNADTTFQPADNRIDKNTLCFTPLVNLPSIEEIVPAPSRSSSDVATNEFSISNSSLKPQDQNSKQHKNKKSLEKEKKKLDRIFQKMETWWMRPVSPIPHSPILDFDGPLLLSQRTQSNLNSESHFKVNNTEMSNPIDSDESDSDNFEPPNEPPSSLFPKKRKQSERNEASGIKFSESSKRDKSKQKHKKQLLHQQSGGFEIPTEDLGDASSKIKSCSYASSSVLCSRNENSASDYQHQHSPSDIFTADVHHDKITENFQIKFHLPTRKDYSSVSVHVEFNTKSKEVSLAWTPEKKSDFNSKTSSVNLDKTHYNCSDNTESVPPFTAHGLNTSLSSLSSSSKNPPLKSAFSSISSSPKLPLQSFTKRSPFDSSNIRSTSAMACDISNHYTNEQSLLKLAKKTQIKKTPVPCIQNITKNFRSSNQPKKSLLRNSSSTMANISSEKTAATMHRVKISGVSNFVTPNTKEKNDKEKIASRKENHKVTSSIPQTKESNICSELIEESDNDTSKATSQMESAPVTPTSLIPQAKEKDLCNELFGESDNDMDSAPSLMESTPIATTSAIPQGKENVLCSELFGESDSELDNIHSQRGLPSVITNESSRLENNDVEITQESEMQQHSRSKKRQHSESPEDLAELSKRLCLSSSNPNSEDNYFWKLGKSRLHKHQTIDTCLSRIFSTGNNPNKQAQAVLNATSTFANPTCVYKVDNLIVTTLLFLGKTHKNVFIEYFENKRKPPLITNFEENLIDLYFTLEAKQKAHLKSLVDGFMTTLLAHCMTKEFHNLYAQAAYCRVYTLICKKLGKLERIPVFCYDIMIRKRQYGPFLLASVCSVWPDVFTEHINHADNHPIYRTFRYILSRPSALNETLLDQSKKILKDIGNFEPAIDDTANDIVKDFVQQLLILNVKNEAERSVRACEVVKAMILLAICEGWQWTVDILLGQFLWPLLHQWGAQIANGQKDSVPIQVPDEAAASVVEFCGYIGLLCAKEQRKDTLGILAILQALLTLEASTSQHIQKVAFESLFVLLTQGFPVSTSILSQWFSKNQNEMVAWLQHHLGDSCLEVLESYLNPNQLHFK